jgi:hypothetical protein
VRDQTWASNHIQQAYDRLGYELGWRLLGCPWANLAAPHVALITLNPGGSKAEPNIFAPDVGCIYETEGWLGKKPGSHPLQLQIQRLFGLAGVQGDEVLSGYLVPFRSPTWAALQKREEALEFGVGMWRELLGDRRPQLTFTIGADVFRSMHDILKGRAITPHPSGWGNVRLRICEYDGGKLIGLPHLSRFQLFGDEPQAIARQQIIERLIGRIG